MSAAVAAERSSAREVSRIMLTPKAIAKRHRILPSTRTRNRAQLARFKPVAPPATVGSVAAAKYMPEKRTFAGRIPSSANPRSASSELTGKEPRVQLAPALAPDPGLSTGAVGELPGHLTCSRLSASTERGAGGSSKRPLVRGALRHPPSTGVGRGSGEELQNGAHALPPGAGSCAAGSLDGLRRPAAIPGHDPGYQRPRGVQLRCRDRGAGGRLVPVGVDQGHELPERGAARGGRRAGLRHRRSDARSAAGSRRYLLFVGARGGGPPGRPLRRCVDQESRTLGPDRRCERRAPRRAGGVGPARARTGGGGRG